MFYYWFKRKNLIVCVIFALFLISVIAGMSGNIKVALAGTFTENFTGTTYYDSTNSTGVWYDAFISSYGRLWGKFFTNAKGTVWSTTTPENIANTGTVDSYDSRMAIDSNGNPYVIWYDAGASYNTAYFSRWAPTGCGGSGCWSTMDGTAGKYNFGNYLQSEKIVIDSSNNPYVVFALTSGDSARFARWNPTAQPAVCGTGITGCWTNMKGDVAGLESAYTSTGTTYDCDMVLNSAGNPYIFCDNYSTALKYEFTKWTPTGCSGTGCWTKMDGTAGYDLVRTGYLSVGKIFLLVDSSDNAQVVFNTGPSSGVISEVLYAKGTVGVGWSAAINLSNSTSNYSSLGDAKLDSNDYTYITWADQVTGNYEAMFTHYNGSAWVTMAGVSGYENLSSTSTASTQPSIALDTSNNPYIVWQENAGTGSYDIYFKKWTVGAGESVCGAGVFNCWTNMAGTSTAVDNISSVLSYASAQPIIVLDSSQNPIVTWRETNYGLIERKWDTGSSSWKGLNTLSTVTYAMPHGAAANYSQVLLYNDLPYLTEYNAGTAPKDVFFGKYYPTYRASDTLRSLTFDTDSSSIIQATITATQTLNSQDITYQVSNNGGTTWCGDDNCSGDVVTQAELTGGQNVVNFTSQASDLRWQANLSTTDTTVTPLIDSLTVTTTTGTISVTSPNTAVTWNYNSSYSITWSNTGTNGTNVKIDISRDGGSSWATLLASTPNDGTQAWTVTAPATTQARIRVTDLTYPAKNDMSDVNFTISAPTITVTAPNGGQTWYGGESQDITWTNTGTITNVKLEYSKDNFVSDLHTIESSISNTGTYPWTVANDISSTVKVRVSHATDPLIYDDSDSNFTISSPTITVTAPDGGQTWYVGESHNITWTNNGTIANVNIVYSKNNFDTTTPVAGPITNTGTYPWTIPTDPSSTIKVKVSSASDSNIYDVSNDYSTFSYSSLEVTAPNGTETWYAGETQNITWDILTGTVANVKLEYSKDDFLSDLHTIITSTPNTGSYPWEIPFDQSLTVKVRVTDTDYTPVTDTSDDYFEISGPSITLTSPNGSELWAVGDIEYVTWTTSGTVGDVKIEYSTNNFVTTQIIVAATPNDGSYDWEIPMVESDTIKIRISAVSNPSLTDMSDHNFIVNLAGVYLSWEILPILVFDVLDEAGATNESACVLGTLVPNVVTSCQYRIGIGTNNSGGFYMQVQDSEGQDGLRAGGARIADVSDNLVDSGEEAGIRVVNVPAGVSRSADFPAGQDRPIPGVEAKTLLYSYTPVTYVKDDDLSDTILIRYSVVIDRNTSAGNYSQTIKYSITARY